MIDRHLNLRASWPAAKANPLFSRALYLGKTL